MAGYAAEELGFSRAKTGDFLRLAAKLEVQFRAEHQYTAEDEEVKSGYLSPGEAKRDDDNFCHVSCWEYTDIGKTPNLHKESLEWSDVKPSVRSYK